MRTSSLLIFSLDIRGLYVYCHIVAVFELSGFYICRYLEDEITVHRETRRYGRRGYALVAGEKAAVLRYAVYHEIGLFVEAFFIVEVICQHEMHRNISVALLHGPRVAVNLLYIVAQDGIHGSDRLFAEIDFDFFGD